MISLRYSELVRGWMVALGVIKVDKIELGDIAKDPITGFKGIVIGETKWLHGCIRLTIQPQELKDGKPIEAHSFDYPQLVLVKKKAAIGTGDTGGPRPEPTRPKITR